MSKTRQIYITGATWANDASKETQDVFIDEARKLANTILSSMDQIYSQYYQPLAQTRDPGIPCTFPKLLERCQIQEDVSDAGLDMKNFSLFLVIPFRIYVLMSDFCDVTMYDFIRLAHGRH